jgi:hypothetical protein
MANELQTIDANVQRQAFDQVSASGGRDLPANPDAGAFLPARDPLEDIGFTRATDPFNPAESGQFQEFLRRQGASAGRARAAIAKRMAELQKRQDRRIEDLGIQEDRGARNVRGDFEQRGLFGSGRALRAEDELRGDVERTRSRFLEDLAEERAELESRRGRIGSGSGARRAAELARIRRQYILTLAQMGRLPNFGAPAPAAPAPVAPAPTPRRSGFGEFVF